MKQVVFRSTVDSFERKQTYKDLRRKDVSGYAHAMLISHGSTIDLVQHELNKCLSDYPEHTLKLRYSNLLKCLSIKCNNETIYTGKYKDVEEFYQKSSQAFYHFLQNQIH